MKHNDDLISRYYCWYNCHLHTQSWAEVYLRSLLSPSYKIVLFLKILDISQIPNTMHICTYLTPFLLVFQNIELVVCVDSVNHTCSVSFKLYVKFEIGKEGKHIIILLILQNRVMAQWMTSKIKYHPIIYKDFSTISHTGH